MDISLRKSAALQLLITETLKRLRLDGALTLSIYEEDPEARIRTAREEFTETERRRGALLDALYDLRVRTGEANAGAGVDRLLAELARIERDVQFLTQMGQSQIRDAEGILSARIARMRTRDEAPVSRFGAPQALPETIQLSVFEQADLDRFQSDLRALTRRRQGVKDELVELNARTMISPSPETVATLRAEELI
jgi:hypothetical protein